MSLFMAAHIPNYSLHLHMCACVCAQIDIILQLSMAWKCEIYPEMEYENNGLFCWGANT